MNTGETPFTEGWPVLVTAAISLAPKRAGYLKPGVPDECRPRLLPQRSSLSGSLVLVNQPLGGELPSGFRWALVESAAGVASRRLAVAVCSRLTVLILGGSLLFCCLDVRVARDCC
jgi:hypothetical protein